MKKRYLFVHQESDSLFEEHLSDEELEKFFNGLDGSHCDDVTGNEKWESEFKKLSQE